MKIRVKSKIDEYLTKLQEEQGINITKSSLSRKIYADPSQLYRWSKNKNDGFIETAPSVGYALLLAQVLKCNVEDLFEFEVTPEEDLEFLIKDMNDNTNK